MPDDPGANLGEVPPRKKAGFTTYLIIGVIAVLVIGGVMLFTGGNGDKPGNDGTNSGTPAVTIPQLKSSIDSLNAKLDGFSGRLANVETTIAGLSAPTVTKAEFNSLQAQLNALEAIIANLTGNGGGGNGTNYLDETSRWDFDSLRVVGYTGDYLNFEVIDKDPSRIEDEDLYEITVRITNTDEDIADNPNTIDINETHTALAISLNYGFELVVSPRDYCMVDEGATYLDSDSYPYLSWETDFVIKERQGQGTCRRITFTSDKYNLGTLEPDKYIELDLVFELYYA